MSTDTIAGSRHDMTANEVVATAETRASRFAAREVAEIRDALAEADEEFARGEGMGGEEVRCRLGLS